VLDRISDTHRVLIVDFAAVPLLDSTAANIIEGLAHKATRHEVKVVLTGTSRDIRRELYAHKIKPPLVTYAKSIDEAVVMVRKMLAEASPTGSPHSRG
jgi:sulfate permease, SulP family